MKRAKGGVVRVRVTREARKDVWEGAGRHKASEESRLGVQKDGIPPYYGV